MIISVLLYSEERKMKSTKFLENLYFMTKIQLYNYIIISQKRRSSCFVPRPRSLFASDFDARILKAHLHSDSMSGSSI